MVCSQKDMSKWKNEQVEYFRRYLDNFDEDSKQYRVIKRGIAELESAVL
ncbi:MAG: hypothetical protein ACOC2H_03440 [Spirochaetota bacterium]